MNSNAETVYNTVDSRGPMTIRAIAEATGLAVGVVKDAISALSIGRRVRAERIDGVAYWSPKSYGRRGPDRAACPEPPPWVAPGPPLCATIAELCAAHGTTDTTVSSRIKRAGIEPVGMRGQARLYDSEQVAAAFEAWPISPARVENGRKRWATRPAPVAAGVTPPVAPVAPVPNTVNVAILVGVDLAGEVVTFALTGGRRAEDIATNHPGVTAWTIVTGAVDAPTPIRRMVAK